MGAGASSILVGTESNRVTELGDLPEGCVAEVLRRLDPPEICRLAGLSRTFRGAASADMIWETKLPRNYKYLNYKALGEKEEAETGSGESKNTNSLSKREVYARLCLRNLLDGGNKEFWLEKSSGCICILISSKALSITGIDDRRYWNYIRSDESRFGTVAYLQQIWWLEVRGEINFEFPEGSYSVYFRLHLGRSSRRLGRRICIHDRIHGWDVKPVHFQLSTSDGQIAQSKSFLHEPGAWVRYHVGDFIVNKSDVVTRVMFSLAQIDCTHSKGGLCVDSVLIQPKGVGPLNI